MNALFLAAEAAYLRYLDFPGRAPARVYLHCLGGAAALYLRAALDPALAGRRAILVDLLGFGLSDRPGEFAYAPRDHARAVAALLDHLGVRACDLIGHSMGGHVATALALARPELVGRLVLAEAPLSFGHASASARIADQPEASFLSEGFSTFLAELRAEARDDAATAAFCGSAAVAAPRALYRSAVGLVRDGEVLRDRFLGLPLPRAYIWGAETLRDPAQARWRERFATAGIATASIPGAGHHMNLENPGGLAAALGTIHG